MLGIIGFLHQEILQAKTLLATFSACVYRKTAIDALPDALFEITAYDWITNIMVGKNGMIGCLTDVMSFYRLHRRRLEFE